MLCIYQQIYNGLFILATMRFKGALLDLDNTLVQSSPEHRYLLVGDVLKKMGTTTSQKNIDDFWYESHRNTIIREQFGVDHVAFWEIYKVLDTVALRLQHTSVYEDVSVLKKLHAEGYRLGIVTGAPPSIAAAEINLVGPELFDVVVSANPRHGLRSKPHPDGFHHALDKMRFLPEHVIYVGNGREDVEGAQNAGIVDVLMDRGEYSYPNLKPFKTITTFYQVEPILLNGDTP